MVKLTKADNPLIGQLGAYMRKLRVEKGYTSSEPFAYDHDLPRAQYGRYERGEDLRFSSLMKVIDAFGISPSEFFIGLEKEMKKAKKKSDPKG